jgi:hypothetical protein
LEVESPSAFRQLLSRPSVEESILGNALARALRKPDTAFTDIVFASDNVGRLLDAVPTSVIVAVSASVLNSPTIPRDVTSAHLNFLAHPFLSRYPQEINKVVEKAFWEKLLLTKSGRKSGIDAWKAHRDSGLEKGGLLGGKLPVFESQGQTLAKLNVVLAEFIASKQFRSAVIFYYLDGADIIAENLLADEANREARLDFLLKKINSKESPPGSLLARLVLVQAITLSPAVERVSLALRVLKGTGTLFAMIHQYVRKEEVSVDFEAVSSLVYTVC